jgi:hypothetical protein
MLSKLLTLDDVRLSTQIAVMITNNVKYEQVINRNGPGAQALLNLLQAVCGQCAVNGLLTQVFHGCGSA